MCVFPSCSNIVPVVSVTMTYSVRIYFFPVDLDKNVMTEECKDGTWKTRIEKMIKNLLFGFCLCSTQHS